MVFASSDIKGFKSYLNVFGQKIALEMSSDKYMDIFNAKMTEMGTTAGRGFANVTMKSDDIEDIFRMNAPYELQFDEETKIYIRCVKKYLTFSDVLTFSEYDRLKQTPITPEKKSEGIPFPISVDFDYIDFYPFTVDFSELRIIDIYAKNNLLRLIR